MQYKAQTAAVVRQNSQTPVARWIV